MISPRSLWCGRCCHALTVGRVGVRF